METFCFTFGQTHTHPETGIPLKDYWVEIAANSLEKARAHMFELFGAKWAFSYHEKRFMRYRNMYPKGCLERWELD